MSDEAYVDLVNSIIRILMKNGIKSTKMDDIATQLQMSKRTLYEIFNSKEDMVIEAMNQFNRNLLEENLNYQRKCNPSVLDALIKTFLLYRDIMSEINVKFFSDFDFYFADIRYRTAESENAYWNYFAGLLDQAAKEGYIRENSKYQLQGRIMQIQMTLLKQMEQFFPSDISLIEVYDHNTVSFLRSIASEKGLKEIDSRINYFNRIHKEYKKQAIQVEGLSPRYFGSFASFL